MNHVHLIGIGGSGLSAIARVLLERGIEVSGSDRQASPVVQALQAAGARVFIGHRMENIQGAQVIVRSSAVPEENVEVQAARAAGLPVLKRAEFLAYILEGYQVIAVAGTHGKTTTTAMVTWLLEALGEQPSFIIGGTSLNLGTNAHAGQGAYFVIEADEYDGMFLGLSPRVAVVTNVEHDHPDCYPTMAEFYRAFQRFVDKVQAGGMVIACADDPHAYHLSQEALQKGLAVRTFGLNRWLGREGPTSFARNLEINSWGGYTFEAFFPEGAPNSKARQVQVHLQVPGRHNVLNALAALNVIDGLGLSLERAAQALTEFRGTERRFEVVGEVKGIVLIDDYAHHPSEIRATLQAARARFAEHSIWAVWQPHTYSRTRTLLNEFIVSFGEADHVLITEIYPARENPPTDGFSARQVVERMSHSDVHWMADLEQTAEYLLQNVKPKAVILVLSAGDGYLINRRVLEGLESAAKHLTAAQPGDKRVKVTKE